MSHEGVSNCIEVVEEVANNHMYPCRRPILVVLAPVRISGNSEVSLWAVPIAGERTLVWVDRILIQFLQSLARNGCFVRDLRDTVEYVFLPRKLSFFWTQ